MGGGTWRRGAGLGLLLGALAGCQGACEAPGPPEEQPIPHVERQPGRVEDVETRHPMTNAAVITRPDGKTVLVASLVTSGQLLVIEPGGAQQRLELPRGALAGVYPCTGGALTLESTGRHAIVLGFDGAALVERAAIEVGATPRVAAWVLARGEARPIVHADLAAHTVLAATVAGDTPVDLELGPGGDWLYVANLASADISVIAAQGSEVSVSIPVAPSPWRLFAAPATATVERDRLYVLHANSPTLTAIDTRRRLRELSRDLDAVPSKVAISASGAYIYALAPGAGRLTLLDASNLATIATHEVPVGSSDLAVVGDGLRAWVLVSTGDRGELWVFRVEGESLRRVATPSLEAAAGRIAATPDGAHVWLIGPRTGRVARFALE